MVKSSQASDFEIEQLYDSGSLHLTQERNDFLLPQILDFVKQRQWVNLQPEYQRRLVWDKSKKSQFIESLLMNVPVPPIFLYEYELSRYEVMDGQQRLNSIIEFYQDELVLSGLTTWSVLNGRRRSECPAIIQRGLDRRRVSATVLIPEGRVTTAHAFDVRREVFERLNTGGLGLNAQELRHALYPSAFNSMVVEVSGLKEFRELWRIPMAGKPLFESTLYKRMGDCELVLRFFAFRDSKRIKGSVRSMLDATLRDSQRLSDVEVGELRSLFRQRLVLAKEVLGKNAFELSEGGDKKKLSAPLYDALMVALDHLWDSRSALRAHRTAIRDLLQREFAKPAIYELLVGRGNTADSLKKRIRAVEHLLLQAIG